MTANTSSLDNKISVGLSDTDIISPFLLQDTPSSKQRYDTPAKLDHVILPSSQSDHMPVSTKKHVYNYNEYASLHIYTDGSCSMNTASRLNRVAGWGVAIYMTQTNIIGTTDHVTTTEESSLTELFGSVVTDSKSPFFLGAALHTNNTGELTALGEAIIWLISNWKQLCTSISTPLKNVVIHSDSNYAINAIIGTESGPSNVQLYSHIRQLLREFKQSLQPYNLAGNGLSSAPIKAPTFSIRKVKAHAGIKGNEKADILAQMGQHQVCNSGRYFILPQSNLSTNCLHNSSKNFNGVSKLSLNDISKNLEVTHIAHETSIGDQFSNFCNLPSLQQQLHSSLSSPSSSSTASDPAEYPLGLKDYD